VPIDDSDSAGITGAANAALVHRLLGPEIEKLSARERKRMLAVLLVWLFVLTPAAAYGILRLLLYWAELRVGNVGPSSVAIQAGVSGLIVPSGFVAFITTGILLSLGLEWSKWKASEHKFRWISFSLSALAVAGFCAVAMADWYLVLGPDHIRYNPFFSVTERAYWHDQARSIRSAPERIDELGLTEATGRQYLVCFVDGSLWGSMWHPGNFPEEDRTRLAQRIAERSGVAIVEMKVFERKDHACSGIGPIVSPA
jgi:hypothetical protein